MKDREKDNQAEFEPETREFLKETIRQQPLTRREAVTKTAFYGFVAIVFGGLAAASFTGVRIAMESLIQSKVEVSPVETVAFPGDDPDAILEPQDPAEIIVPVMPEISDEKINEAVQSVLDTREYTVEDVHAMGQALMKIGSDADKSIVEVTTGRNRVDMFGNDVEKLGSYAGAIVAQTKSEYLIFTLSEAARDADFITVCFADGTTAPAEIKQTDQVWRMAVLSVKQADVPEEKRRNIAPFTVGNSYMAKQGDIFVTVGAPAGIIRSTSYGSVSAVSRGASIVDGTARVIYLDANACSHKGTFLLNLDGELIGWVDNSFSKDSDSGHVTAMGVSDYKAELEKLSNGEPISYFGIYGQEVVNPNPNGVYVTTVVAGSPAYDVGIQDGDIITSFDGVQVTTVRELEVAIEHAAVDKKVAVNIMRKGRDDYSSLDFEVVLRAR